MGDPKICRSYKVVVVVVVVAVIVVLSLSLLLSLLSSSSLLLSLSLCRDQLLPLLESEKNLKACKVSQESATMAKARKTFIAIFQKLLR